MIIAAIEYHELGELYVGVYDGMKQFTTMQDVLDYIIDKLPYYQVMDIFIPNSIDEYRINYWGKDRDIISLIEVLKNNKLIVKATRNSEDKLVWEAVE